MPRRSKAITRRRDRNTLERLTEEIHELKGRGARILYEIGVRLARIQDEALWERAGHESLEAYLSEECRLSRTTAYKAIRVARHFNGEIAEAYGIEKLNAALQYVEATPAQAQARRSQPAARLPRGQDAAAVAIADTTVALMASRVRDIRKSRATLGRPPIPHPRRRAVLVRFSDAEWGSMRRALEREHPVARRRPSLAAWVRDLVVAHASEVLAVQVTRAGLRHLRGGVPDWERWRLARAVRKAARRRRRR